MSARPGRKAGPEGKRRDELRLIIRLTEAERVAFQAAADRAKMGLGPWVRKLARVAAGLE